MATSVAAIKKQLKKLIVQSLELDIEPDDIEDGEILFGGFLGLDSVGTLILTTAIEEEFDIEIQDEDLTAGLFASINSLADYIAQQLSVEQV